MRSTRMIIIKFGFILFTFTILFLVDADNIYAQTNNCGRQVIGRVKDLDRNEILQPENDEGAALGQCYNSVIVPGAESNGTLIIKNSAGADSNWSCKPDNPEAAYDRSVPSSQCGEGPFTFTFVPPAGFDCTKDVSWSIGYPTCAYGCTDYQPPASAKLQGSGCTATVYLGTGLYDNHLWWYLKKPVPTPTSPPSCVPVGDGDTTTPQDYAAWSYYFDPYGNAVTGGRSVGDFDCNGVVEPKDYSIWSNYYFPVE